MNIVKANLFRSNTAAQRVTRSGGRAVARDLVYAAACVLALFSLPPLFRLVNRFTPPETFVLRDVTPLVPVLPLPETVTAAHQEPVEESTPDPMSLVMPSAAPASAPPSPLLANWSPPLPSLFGDPLTAFPIGAWSPGDLVFEQNEVDVPPRPLAQSQPRYPLGARRAGIEGLVEIEAVVLADGRVDRIRVLHESPPSVFAQAARAAVERWRFEPARRRDRPVNARIRVTLEFKLDR